MGPPLWEQIPVPKILDTMGLAGAQGTPERQRKRHKDKHEIEKGYMTLY